MKVLYFEFEGNLLEHLRPESRPLRKKAKVIVMDHDEFYGDINDDDSFMREADIRSMQRELRTIAFQEGMEIVKENALQRGFDEGYELGFAANFSSAAMKSVKEALSSDEYFSRVSPEDIDILAQELLGATAVPKSQFSLITRIDASVQSEDGEVIHRLFSALSSDGMLHLTVPVASIGWAAEALVGAGFVDSIPHADGDGLFIFASRKPA